MLRHALSPSSSYILLLNPFFSSSISFSSSFVCLSFFLYLHPPRPSPIICLLNLPPSTSYSIHSPFEPLCVNCPSAPPYVLFIIISSISSSFPSPSLPSQIYFYVFLLSCFYSWEVCPRAVIDRKPKRSHPSRAGPAVPDGEPLAVHGQPTSGPTVLLLHVGQARRSPQCVRGREGREEEREADLEADWEPGRLMGDGRSTIA